MLNYNTSPRADRAGVGLGQVGLRVAAGLGGENPGGVNPGGVKLRLGQGGETQGG